MKRSIKRAISVFLILLLMCSTVLVSVNAAKDNYPNTHKNTGDQRVDIAEVARTQVGYREGDNNDTKYGTWYGLPNQPWCAMFVSWCARQAGVPLDILRNCAIAAPDPGYFDIPYYNSEEYTPKQGDLFFTKTFSHVGIVDYVDGKYFYTLEGNTNDSGSSVGIGVFALRRTLKDYYFGVPDYNYASKNHTCKKDVFVQYSEEHPHNAVYKCSVCARLIEDSSKTGAVDSCIVCNKPSKPVVSIRNDPFLGDNAVTFEWSESDNATYYDFTLEYLNSQGVWKTQESVSGASSGFTWQLAEGRYRCRVTAYNSRYTDSKYPDGFYSQSDYREFSVGKVLYTITYNMNDGTDNVQTQIKHQGLDSVLSADEPWRDGYVFMGWSENSDAKSPEYKLGSVYKKDSSVVLYAVWRDANARSILGDSNADEIVNIKDATSIQKHLAEIVLLNEQGVLAADADLNGLVNIKDATAIQKHLAGISTGLPIGEYYI